MMKRHEYFTPEEWADLTRVTERWSKAGRATDELTLPATSEQIARPRE